MADYREISQEYAQGGIKAVALLNGGAAVAILTQLKDLSALAQPVLVSSIFWAIGLTACSLAWMAAFISARHVDNSERSSGGTSDAHITTSNNWMYAGLFLVIFSLAMFLAGALYLAAGYHARFAT